MSGEKATQEQVNEAYRRAGELSVRGLSADGIRQYLIRRGWSESAAATIVTDVTGIVGCPGGRVYKAGSGATKRAWLALAITCMVAAIGTILFVDGGMIPQPQPGASKRFEPAKWPTEVHVGLGLLVVALIADLYTMVAVASARCDGRKGWLWPVDILARFLLLGALAGAIWLALPFLQ
jgi:hypothetical protein